MPTVFVETTIPSFYLDRRTHWRIRAWSEYTRAWWDHHRKDHELVTSDFVLKELEAGPRARSKAALALMAGIRVLPEHPRLAEVIQFYLDNRLVPRTAAVDASHLALASLHDVRFLLTWNCKHLANANKFEHIRVLNGRLGISVPTITTPVTMMPEEEV
jgi:hypothetical protein